MSIPFNSLVRYANYLLAAHLTNTVMVLAAPGTSLATALYTSVLNRNWLLSTANPLHSSSRPATWPTTQPSLPSVLNSPAVSFSPTP
jgi:hypothetical protein